ncbi:MAG: GNAT family N-acetyltransferase [Pedosphaera sp.]|nr:GNAT family N-acetyltransferase [Pedosphaera sp.]
MISTEQIDYMLRLMYSPERLNKDLELGIIYELALHKEKPCGYLALEYQPATSTAMLHKLYLLPELHGLGYGHAMLLHVSSLARSMSATEILLRVNQANGRAIQAYRRAGFSIKDSVRDDIGSGFVMDDFLMAKTVQSS